MAHQLETFTDGTAAFVSARLDAWHRLGTLVEHAMTAEEAMNLAYLSGWNVRKLSLTTTEITPDGVETLTVPDAFATVRTHPKTGRPDVLGVVGSDYTPVQNEEVCDLLGVSVRELSAAATSVVGVQRRLHGCPARCIRAGCRSDRCW